MPEELRPYDFPTPSRPASLEAELRGALTAAMVYISQGETVPANVMPLPIRAKLIARRVSLQDEMRPGSVGEIARLWSTMIDMRGGFKAVDSRQAEGIGWRRAKDLKHVRLWAVCEAVAAFRLARIGAGVFKPPTGPIGKEADLRAQVLITELANLRLVLAAPIAEEPTEEGLERKREFGRRMRELGERLATSGDGGRAQAARYGGR